jgi:hypothetical protein
VGGLDGLRDRPGLGYHLELGASPEQGDESLADHLVIVDDEEGQRFGRLGGHQIPR